MVSFVGSDFKIDEIHFKSQPLNTGIFNYENLNTISVYPNPATDNIIIESPQKAEIEIVNLQGQLIKYLVANNNKTTIDISELPGGMYFIKAKTEKGIAIEKFVKE
ncbi:MAG: T9SS type A sorting domain-containing protein [Bacteroidota bacterium]